MTDALARPLACSIGDPAGVGPELICEAWSRRETDDLPSFFVVAGPELLATAAEVRGLEVPVEIIDDAGDAASIFPDALPVLGSGDVEYSPGEPTRAGAQLALDSLESATGLVLMGEASGLVTGPVAKGLLATVGFTHPGQTEFLADACGVPADEVVMMLAGPSLRAVPVTVHCALADVADVLTTRLIGRKAMILAEALARDFAIANPRLAIAGLNPHAGEDGRFGDEEARIIRPAIEALRGAGVNATGPHPADAMFTPRARTTYDAAVCMYHDQALVPLKALDFDAGVNVTLGLPIVRTSADHGTAFDIAGKAQADPGATIAAIRMAGEMASRRAVA